MPREGLIHSLMTAEVDGARLTEEEVIANTIVTMVGGQETTTNLIGNGLLTLLRNPERAGAAARRSRDHRDRGRGTAALREPEPAHRAPRAGRCDAGRQAHQQARRGDGGDGGRQSRSRALPRSRPARSDRAGQSPSRLRLGGAFLLRRAVGAHGGPDRLHRAARPAQRHRAAAAASRLARKSRPAWPQSAERHVPRRANPSQCSDRYERHGTDLSEAKRLLLQKMLAAATRHAPKARHRSRRARPARPRRSRPSR